MLTGFVKNTFLLAIKAMDWCRARFNEFTNHPRVTTFGTLLIFLFSIRLIAKELSEFNIDNINFAFDDVRLSYTIMAILATIMSFTALSFNDRFCLAMIGKKVSYARSVRASLASYSLAKTLGYSWAIASTARAKLYSKWGLSASEVGALSMTSGTAVQVGSLTAAAIGLWVGAEEIAKHGHLAIIIWYVVAFILTIPSAIWLLVCNNDIASFKWGKTFVYLPTFKKGLLHLTTILFDKGGAALCLYFLFPSYDGGWSFPSFLAVFILAGLLGALSGAPGGLGVFEAAILTMAPSSQNIPGAAVALILYRLIYNIIPLIIATIIIGLDQAAPVAKPAAKAAKKWGSVAYDAAPQIMSMLVFFSGFLLLASCATPAFSDRLIRLQGFIPQITIEIAHFLSAICATILMIIANYLWRESRFAFKIAIAFLIMSMVFAIFKGLSWEVAVFLIITSALLLFVNKEFVKPFGKGGFNISYKFSAAIIGVIATLAWFSYFAYNDSIDFDIELFFDTGIHADAARSLRAIFASGFTFVSALLIVWLLGEEKDESI